DSEQTVPPLELGSFSYEATLRDSAGRPVAGSSFALLPSLMPDAGQIFFAVSAANGGVRLTGLAAGTYIVRIQGAGHADFAQRITVTGNTTTAFVLAAGVAVDGTIRRATGGAPLADAYVAFVHPGTGAVVGTAVSGADGRYRLDRLLPGT